MKTNVFSLILVFIFINFNVSSLSAGTLGDIDNNGSIGLPEAVYALQATSGLQTEITASTFIVWKNQWQSAQSYEKYDAVFHEGSSFICIIGHTSDASNQPPNTATWNILAEKGDGDGHSLDSADNSVEDAVYVNNAGFVGIGTNDPYGKLHVDGALRVQPTDGDSRGIEIMTNTSAQTANLIQHSGPGAALKIGNYEGGTGPGLIVERGNVGIGTTSPDYLLHVNGDAAGTGWTNLSSKEYKEEIKKINSPTLSKMLARLMDMDLTTYKYNLG